MSLSKLLLVLVLLVPAMPAVSVAQEVENVSEQTEIVKQTLGSPFRRELIKAAIAAQKDGQISRKELVKLRIASFSPAFLQRAQQVCVTQMAFSGEGGDHLPLNEDGTIKTASIDWEGLAAFLEKIVPLVLAILKAFGI